MTDQIAEHEVLSALSRWNQPSTRRQFLRRSGLLVGTTAVLGSVADILAACAQSTSTSGAVVTGGHVVYGSNDINSLFPGNHPFDAEYLLQALMFDGLVAVSAGGDLIPQIAAGLGQFSADGLTATFKLRNDVKWTDGTPVTAKDVVFSYTIDIDPAYKGWNSPSRGSISEYLQSVTALDDHTVQFTAKKVDAQFSLIGSRLIAPQHVLGSLSGTDLNTTSFVRNPSVSSGAFKFDHWDQGSQVVLTRNSNYYLGSPHLENFVYKILAANQNRSNLLQTDEMDWGSVQLSDYDKMKTVDTVDLISVGHGDVDVVLMNMDPAKPYYQIFGDKSVRQALLYALDRTAMLNAVYFGHGEVAKGIILSSSWAYNKNIQPQYNFNKSKAESLLDAAGWVKNSSGVREKNGVELKWEIHGYNFPNYANEAQIMQQQWNAIGCNITVKLGTPQVTVNELLNTRDFPMLIIDFSPSVVLPDIRIYVHSRDSVPGGINGSKISISQLDSLTDQAAATLDRKTAIPIWEQVQNLMADELPLLPLLSADVEWAVNKRVKATQFSLYTSSTNGLPWLNKVWVADGK